MIVSKVFKFHTIFSIICVYKSEEIFPLSKNNAYFTITQGGVRRLLQMKEMHTNFIWIDESLVGLQDLSWGPLATARARTPPIDGVTPLSSRAFALGPPAFTCGFRGKNPPCLPHTSVLNGTERPWGDDM